MMNRCMARGEKKMVGGGVAYNAKCSNCDFIDEVAWGGKFIFFWMSKMQKDYWNDI